MALVRLTLFAALMAALCAASLAQEAPPVEEPPPPALTSKTYDFAGLLELDSAAKTADGISPDAVFSEIGEPVEETLWNVRNQRGGARCWFSAEDAMQYVLMFCTTGEPGTTYSDVAGGQSITLSGDDELHRRVAWTIDSLKAAAAVRVKLRAYDLPQSSGPVCLNAVEAEKAAKNATLLGAVSGQLGETLLLHQLKPWDFIQSYEVAPDGKCSVSSARLNAGRELLAGALLLPDGRLWLQAWSARLDIAEVREINSSCGKLECPRARYSHAPMSALLENNGGAIIDEGPLGRTLLVCAIEGALPNRTLDCGTRTTLGLVNITSTLRGDFPRVSWLAGTEEHDLKLGRAPSTEQNWARSCVLNPATTELATRLSYESEVLGAIVPLGPYLGVRISQPDDDSDASPEEFEASRKHLSESLKSISAGPKAVDLRVRAWRVKTVAAAMAQGNAAAKDFDALGAPVFERSVLALSGCKMGLADLELAALITGDGPAPELGVAAWGAQLQWLARENAAGTDVELRLGLVEGERKIKSTEQSGMVKFERATRLPVQAELNGTLTADGVLCSIVPDGEGYVIMAVQRLR